MTSTNSTSPPSACTLRPDLIQRFLDFFFHWVPPSGFAALSSISIYHFFGRRAIFLSTLRRNRRPTPIGGVPTQKGEALKKFNRRSKRSIRQEMSNCGGKGMGIPAIRTGIGFSATGLLIFGLLALMSAPGRSEEKINRYVGSETCGGCHAEQFDNFKKYSKKAHSFQSIEKMKKGLAPGKSKIAISAIPRDTGSPAVFRIRSKTRNSKMPAARSVRPGRRSRRCPERKKIRQNGIEGL